MEMARSRYVEIWLRHVRSLAMDIGPRGSTTASEHQASDYCERIFGDLGLNVQTETFTSARSIYRPHLLASAVMLIAFAIYPIYGRVSAGIAAFLSLVAFVSDLMELSFRNNIFRRLVPKGGSQNVIATVPPLRERKRDLVLIGHVDSHRTPIIFSTPRWVGVYQSFTTVAFVLFLAQVVLYILGVITLWGWIWPITTLSAACALLLSAMCIQADRTPFSAGANDNATGAGLVLALGEHLRNEPLQHVHVWLVCTGCEEVQHYGATDFFQRRRANLHHPVAIVLESLGCSGPAWLTKEGIVIPFYADRNLVGLAKELSDAHPEWDAYPCKLKGGNTEMADALRVGIPAITLVGMGPRGEMPYWHQVQDTFDKMDSEVMDRAYAFAWALIQALDA